MQNSKLSATRKLLLNLDLASYINYTTHGMWQEAPHLKVLCHTLEEVEAGRLKRVIITMPPRHGKSEVVSKAFPSWCLGKHPDWEIILASYGAELAEGFSRINRDKIREFGEEIFGNQLAHDNAAQGRWGIEGYRGGMYAVGVNGPITGRGARIAIIDDPVKGAMEAASATYRQHTKEWYQTVLRTRLTPDGAIIIVMTRWHKDDLVGWLLEESLEDWTVINMPALAEENDLIGRAPGEALWSERFSLKNLLAIKGDMTPYQWLSLYQQRPTDPEGALFKQEFFRYYTKTTVSGQTAFVVDVDGGDNAGQVYLLPHLTLFMTCDPAASLKTSADWFVLSVWGITPDNYLLLLDVYRARVETPDHLARITQMYNKWNKRIVQIVVEETGIGKSTFQTAKRSRLPVVSPAGMDADKWTRALPMASYYQQGKVIHPKGEPWLRDWESEYLEFPTGQHDDQVDTGSYAGIMFPRIGRRGISNIDDCLI